MTIEESTIARSNISLPQIKSVYNGKVRDVYDLGDKLMMVATDRISAFDHILPRPIPYKGQVLNQLAHHFLKATSDLVPNWLIDSPDPNVSIGLKAEPIRIEMVIRGYLAGHAWRTYKNGGRILCGETMPDGMRENDPFPVPIITPTTKAVEGHDTDISVEDILHQGIVAKKVWQKLEVYTRALFERGTEMASERGLILVDTKYEFGIVNGDIVLIDEIHTPDSSRYFYADGYQDRQDQGIAQTQLSKEFVREWLIANEFQGLEGQVMPVFSDEFVHEISNRYIQLYEHVTGQSFVKADVTNINDRITKAVTQYLK